MTYAIEILKQEIYLLEKALSTWDEKEYPEARKQRDKRLKDLNEAVQLIENPHLKH